MNPYLDGRPASRPLSRFLIFGLAAILAIGGLTTRLFYLQVVSGGQFAELSQGNRTVIQAIPSSRGYCSRRCSLLRVGCATTKP